MERAVGVGIDEEGTSFVRLVTLGECIDEFDRYEKSLDSIKRFRADMQCNI